MTLTLPHPSSQLSDTGGPISGEWYGALADIISQLNTNTYGRFLVNRNGVDQTLATAATYNKIQFTNELLDQDGLFDNATNYRYHPLASGMYLFVVRAQAAMSATQTPQPAIFKNGSAYALGTFIQGTLAAGISSFLSVQSFVSMNGTTDYIEGFCFLPLGVTTIRGTADTEMFGWRVSA